MIGFWTNESHEKRLKGTAGVFLGCFVFTTLSAPFVQASLWEERHQARLGKQEKNEEIGRTFLRAGTFLDQSKSADFNALFSGLEVPEELGSIVESWSALESCARNS